ncbi:MAG: multicopper oxidase domain-containing protein [Gemmatimonadota bacterium]
MTPVRAGYGAMLLLFFTGAPGRPAPSSSLPEVVANDNRQAAGRLVGDTLHLSLVVGMATWHPQAPNGPSIEVAAFAEEGKPFQIPGPLIRVLEGTVLDIQIRNQLTDSTLTIGGMATRPMSPEDTLVLAPGASTRIRFLAGAPGTYFYYGILGVQDSMVEREQLSGALVVDSAGGKADDRIFVMNIWGDKLDSTRYHNALTINGRSFPWNERITTTIGDTLRWRWINATIRRHPMHLHGFYFRVETSGNLFADTVLAPRDRREEVTESMAPGGTMSLVWSPDRPGNWLFHCHIGFHVVAEDATLYPPPYEGEHRFSNDIGHHMAGLVLGISVKAPASWRPPPSVPPQVLRLLVQEGHKRSKAPRALGYVLQQGATPPASDSIEIPGSVLVLTRGQPAEITVVNRLAEATSVHWHGIELESYWDGVVGWSGDSTHLAPRIEPGDSFVAHLRLPRAGTFIYHTHLNDFEQFTSGLYGAIVVLEPGQRFNPETDHVFVVAWDGPADPPDLVVNGTANPAPLVLTAGRDHRFRFINIGMAVRFRITMTRDSTLQRWRHVAKDGADLIDGNRTGPAQFVISVGETQDAVFRPLGRGVYHLQWRDSDDNLMLDQELIVR